MKKGHGKNVIPSVARDLFFLFLCLFPAILFSEIIYFPKEDKPTGLLKLKKGMFSFSAELEIEYIASQGSENLVKNFGNQNIFHSNDTKTRFNIDQFVLIPQVNIKDSARFYTELEFRNNRNDIEVAYLKEAILSIRFPYDVFVEVGIRDYFYSAEWGNGSNLNGDNRRITEAYPINGIAFWKDEHLGLHLWKKHSLNDLTNVYWNACFLNGSSLGHDELTRNRIYPIIQDDRNIRPISSDLTGGHKEIGLGAGLSHTTDSSFQVNTMGFVFGSNLAARDIDFLIDVIPGYTSRSDKKYRLGINHEVNISTFNLFTQYIHARDGLVKRNGLYIQPSIFLFSRPDRDWFQGIRFLYRYNILDIDVKGIGSNISTSSLTWDRVTHTAAVNVRVHPYVYWRNEYHINLEKTGSKDNPSVANNEFLSQLEFRF